jgi:hypothetical protein
MDLRTVQFNLGSETRFAGADINDRVIPALRRQPACGHSGYDQEQAPRKARPSEQASYSISLADFVGNDWRQGHA